MTLAVLLPLLLGPRPPGPVPLVALLCALGRLTMTLWHQLPDRPSQLRAAAVFTAAIDLETLVRGRAAVPARLDLALPLPLALDALAYLVAAIDPLAERWPARVLDWPRCRSEVESLQRYLQAQTRLAKCPPYLRLLPPAPRAADSEPPPPASSPSMPPPAFTEEAPTAPRSALREAA